MPRAPRVALRRRPPAPWQRSVGSLAVSLFGHATLLATGLVATLLLPATRPAPVVGATAISIQLAISPESTIRSASADLGDVAPQPQPPPDALAVPPAAGMAAVLADPTVPPVPMPAPAPTPPQYQKHTRPIDRAAVKGVIGKPSRVEPTSVPPASALPGPAAMSAPATDTGPILIASPRFRVPPRPPDYPRRAIASHAQGEALIGALLDPTGAPHDMRVLRSSGHPMLDRAALDAVGNWAFEPGRRAGHPVAARIEIPVRFTLR